MGMAREAINPDGSQRKRMDQLARAVYGQHDQANPSTTGKSQGLSKESQSEDYWPTPASAGSTGGATGLAGGSGNRAKMKRIMGGEVNARLNPDWVSMLMGIPVGWVHPEGVRNRVDELRMLGNGVVPQTAAKAFTTLAGRFHA
jgi:hypothetical protein